MSELESLVVKAIAAHGQWKVRLQQAIDTGQSEWSVEQVTVDDQCVLGKWIYGDAMVRFPGDPWCRRFGSCIANFTRRRRRSWASPWWGGKQRRSRRWPKGGSDARLSGSLVRALQKLGQKAA